VRCVAVAVHEEAAEPLETDAHAPSAVEVPEKPRQSRAVRRERRVWHRRRWPRDGVEHAVSEEHVRPDKKGGAA
jgi:hypothetical protein